jgi:hypothetical protein
MIELMMLLFIAGGQHKPAKAPCTLTNVSASGSFSTNCEVDRNWRGYGDGKKAADVRKPATPSGEIFGHAKPTKDDPAAFYDYAQHPRHEQLGGSYADPIHPLAAYLVNDGRPYPPKGDDDSASITVRDGSKVVMLGFAEYSHLQALRKAVADEEKRLAVKYGARPSDPGEPCIVSTCDSYWPKYRPADRYEYHGQFLLIEKEGR